MADAVAELIARFRESSPDDEETRLDALAALEEKDDARVLPFFLEVLGDSGELDLARIEVCEILSERERGTTADREKIATTLASVLRDDEGDDVRGYSAMALWSYLDIPEARKAIDAVVANRAEPRVVRHNALAALERGGDQPRSRAVLVQLEVDPDLGRSVKRILGEWDPDRDTGDE